MVVVLMLIVIALIVVIRNIKIIPQAHAAIVERLGAYQSTWNVGFHVKIPFIDRIVKTVSLKEQVVDFAPQPVITKDNVTMQIDTVIFFQITDPKLFVYGVDHPISAIENLTATTLRNIIGDLELDETLTSRDTVNTKMRAILDEGGNSGINENLVAKRARLLALKNVDKFESVEVDSFRPDMNYDVANILVSSKINDGLVNSDFAICVADNAVLDRKIYLVMKRKEDKISVLIVNYKRGVIPSFVYEN